MSEALQLNQPELISKSAIASHFGKSAESYHSGALLQRQVGEHLLGLMPSRPFKALMDLGTGPGHFSRFLSERTEQLIGVDIATPMLAYARSHNAIDNCGWLTGDAEQLPLADNCLDGIFSSLMLQWSHSQCRALAEAHRVLKPGASMYFSSLLDGTLGELATAWQAVDDQPHVNRFLTKAELRQAVQGAGFDDARLTFETRTLWYGDVIALMRDLKAIGANTTNNARRGLMGKQQLKLLQQGYEPFRREPGLPASYQVVYGVLTKDG